MQCWLFEMSANTVDVAFALFDLAQLIWSHEESLFTSNYLYFQRMIGECSGELSLICNFCHVFIACRIIIRKEQNSIIGLAYYAFCVDALGDSFISTY